MGQGEHPAQMESTSRNVLWASTRLAELFNDILSSLSKKGQVDEGWKVVDITGTRDRPVSLMFALGNSWKY